MMSWIISPLGMNIIIIQIRRVFSDIFIATLYKTMITRRHDRRQHRERNDKRNNNKEEISRQ